MNTKTTLPISEARKRIFELAEEVQKPGTHYTITEKGRPKAVLMSAEEYESLIETLEVTSDPEIMRDIKKSQEEYARGEYVTLEELMQELGHKTGVSVVADMGKKKYQAKKKK